MIQEDIFAMVIVLQFKPCMTPPVVPADKKHSGFKKTRIGARHKKHLGIKRSRRQEIRYWEFKILV